LLKLLSAFRPYAGRVTIALGLVFCQSLAELYLPTLMADIVDSGVVRGDTPYILRLGGFMLVVALLGMVASVGASYLSSRISMGFGRDLRHRVFARVESFSLAELDRFGTATLITRTTNDVTQVQIFVMMLLRMMVGAPLLCIGGIVMAVRMDEHLSLVLVAVVPVLVGAVVVIAVKGSTVFKRMQDRLDRLNVVLREGLDGVRVIRAFNRDAAEQGRFSRANRELTTTALTGQRLTSLMMPVMMLLMNITAIAILWFGGRRIDLGALHVGGMMAFLQYATQILFSLMMLSMLFVLLPRASVSAARIHEVLETEPVLADPVEPRTPSARAGRVEFRDVVFRYPGAEQAALEHVSFTAEPGEVTAIIGGTGAGKSTLLSLILRFYDVESGRVLVDGVDVRDLRQQELRGRLGYAPQRAVLFSDTVAGNIRYGSDGASPEAVRHAAAVAQAEDFVAAMPEGFETLVAQAGANLSGGQKQRLAMARALARRPAIYLFDDSFSALDFKTDAALRAALRRETSTATVLIAAQRVSTVLDADRIVVLDDGRVAGIGRHRDLVRDCAVYREIVASQLAAPEAA
jgi:ATP-binding cassette subfamily B multidrug efflux pump